MLINCITQSTTVHKPKSFQRLTCTQNELRLLIKLTVKQLSVDNLYIKSALVRFYPYNTKTVIHRKNVSTYQQPYI